MAGELSLKTPLTGLVTLVPTNTATDKTITLPATTGTMVVQDGTNTTTVVNLTATGTVNVGGGNISPQTGFKNRIINGAMTIDQRNAGASVSLAAGFAGYQIDRFLVDNITDGAYTIQQVAEAPTGFTNSLKITVTTADASLGAAQFSSCLQQIEGFNIADFAWGTADARPVTLSFWVRSSLTGTFGGALRGASSTRSYPFTYAISAANTWEQKTVVIPGEPSGTWLVNNSTGVQVILTLGAGSNFLGTAGAWANASLRSATGAANIVSTLGATWQITGVQLERGSVATPFEFRSIGQELALCQRYFEQIYGNELAYAAVGVCSITIATSGRGPTLSYRVTKRAAPTIAIAGSYELLVGGTLSSLTATDIGVNSTFCKIDGTGFTAGQAVTVRNANDVTAKITASAEL